jgi:hypothetical protein
MVSPQPILLPDRAARPVRDGAAEEIASVLPPHTFASLVAAVPATGPVADKGSGEKALSFEPGEAPPAIPASDQSNPYDPHVTIGDAAVRFDAKPLVAPCATETNAMARASGPAIVEPGLQAASASVGAEFVPPELPREHMMPAGGSMVSTVAQADRLFENGLRVALRIPRHIAVAAGASKAPTAHGLAPRLSIEFQRSSKAILPAIAAARPPTNALERSQLFARLVAFDGTYRVRTRGAALSSDEIDRLAERIRASLREYGLADRPVSISIGSGVG